ncbi:MAG: hypothetical protein JWQ19_2123 [Subtercola sp.]|nr:hypothetical protein [Subtercola sp.]
MQPETAQQIDPLSGITARIFVFVVGLVNVGTAIGLALSNGSEVTLPALQIAGIVVLVAAYVYFVWAAEPYRKRVTFRRFSLVFALVALASVFDALSQFGADTAVRNDWGPICLALLLMLAGPYRHPLEIVGFTVIALALVSVTTVIVEASRTAGPYFIALSIVGTPILAIGIGSAIYAGYLISGLTADRAAAAAARDRRDQADRREAIEEFLGRDIRALRSEVLPFFRHLKAQDALTPADIDKAAELQTRLRASIVSNLSADPLEDVVGSFVDPDHLSRRLSEQQRAAVRAVIAFLADQPSINRRDITLSFEITDTAMCGTLHCVVASDRALASRAAPFVGLLQFAFASVTDELAADDAHLTFSF